MGNHNRIGRISSVNYKKGTANVYFGGEGEEMKTHLPFLSHEYQMPEVDDLVLVAFQKYNNIEQGYIIGKYFNSENMPEGGLEAGCYFKRLTKETFIEADGRGNFLLQLSNTASISYDAQEDVLNLTAREVRTVNSK